MIKLLVYKIIAVLVMGIAVGIMYRVPRSLLMYGSFTGLAAWAVYYGTIYGGGKAVAASFLGSLAAGCLSELLARMIKKPATIFIIPGFIPLVPGREAYTSMLHLVAGRYGDGVASGVTTLLIGGAIAFGIFLSTTIFRLLANYQVRGRKTHAGNSSRLD